MPCCTIEMKAETLIQLGLVLERWSQGPISPHGQFLFDQTDDGVMKGIRIQQLSIGRADVGR